MVLGLRVLTLLLTAATLLLPQKWCCSLGGESKACSHHCCTPVVFLPAKSCCACAATPQGAQARPDKAAGSCVCQDPALQTIKRLSRFDGHLDLDHAALLVTLPVDLRGSPVRWDRHFSIAARSRPQLCCWRC